MGRKKGAGYLMKRGKFYYVRIKVDGREIWRSLKTGDKKLAQEKAADFVHPFEMGDTIATLNNLKAKFETESQKAIVKDDKIELSKMLLKYLGHRTDDKLSDGCIDNYNSFVNHLIGWFKKSPYMCDVTERDALTFYQDKKSELAKDRLNATIFCLRRIWKVCMKYDNNIAKNPWLAVEINTKKSNVRKRRELSADEIRKLMETACTDRFEQYWKGETFMLFAIGAFTALRLMDCVSLRWSEVGQDVITKLPHKTAYNGKEAIIPICDDLRMVLANWKISGKSSDDYVLPYLHSLTRRKINKMVHNVFEAAGIKICEIDETGHKKIKTGFHSLRVHGLSEFMRITGNINVVQTIAGHAHPDMTLWYTHCQKQDVINAFKKQGQETPAQIGISHETEWLINQVKDAGESVDDFIKRMILGKQNVIEAQIIENNRQIECKE